MAAEIWAELGIPPTNDGTAIRRAYAARLKASDPDTDPQGFARLRAAYERALAMAALGDGAAKVVLPPTPAPVVPRPVAAVVPTPMLDHLHDGDVLAAAEWLVAARTAGALSLADEVRLADRLGWTLAQDRSLPGSMVVQAADRLGWVQPGQAGPWVKPLGARLDAERWLAGMRQDARSWTRWLGGRRAVAARVMLGRGRTRLLPSMGRDPTLRRLYGEYLIHAAAIGDQFEPKRIEAVDKLLTGGRRRRGPQGEAPLALVKALTWLAMLGLGALFILSDRFSALTTAIAPILFTVAVLALAARAVWRWTRWLWRLVSR